MTVPLTPARFGTVLGQNPVLDILGMICGHAYWFFEDVYPQIRPGRHWTSAPRVLKVLFDPPEQHEAAANEEEREEPPVHQE